MSSTISNPKHQNGKAMWAQYERLSKPSQLRPYIPGEDLSKISVNKVDILEEGGMIARNPNNHNDKWYIGKAYFRSNFNISPISAFPN